MADQLLNMADQFKGLPMQDLIGGPLNAAVISNVKLAQATADFINNVGFYQDDTKDASGAIVNSKGSTRMVDFSFERAGVDNNGNRTIEDVKIKTPMLAIVPVPNLQVDNVDITFDMEVKSSTSEKSSNDATATLDATAKVGWGPFSVEVHIHGSVSSHKENTRSSDNSAKYHVQVQATNHGMPEGLARILDIMAQSTRPTQIHAYKVDDKGSKTGEPVAVPANGNYALAPAANDAGKPTDAPKPSDGGK